MGQRSLQKLGFRFKFGHPLTPLEWTNARGIESRPLTGILQQVVDPILEITL